MVFFHEFAMEALNKDQQCWKDLISLDGKPAKKDLNAITKKKMLAEYEEKTGKHGGKRQLSRIPLWYFLHEILEVDQCNDLVSWEDQPNLVFNINKPKELAALWGLIKNKETMTYPKLARGIRYYYGKGVIEKYRGKRFCYKFVLSNKTKKVLLKHNCLSQEILMDVPKSSSLKRKSIDKSNAKASKKRRSSSSSTDSAEIMSDSCSSEGEDSEFSIENEWESLDNCLSEIFSDATCMKEIFNQDKLFTPSDDVTSDVTTTDVTTDVIKEEEELYNRFEFDNELFCKQEVEETNCSISRLPPDCTEYSPFEQTINTRKKTMSESNSPYISSYFIPSQSFNNTNKNNNGNINYMKNSNNNPGLNVCRSLPDFSLLQTLYHTEEEQQRIQQNNNYISKDVYLQGLDPLVFETSFMENVM